MIVHRLFHDRSIRIAIFACFAIIVGAAGASAQQYAAAQGGGGAPRFLFASSPGEAPVPVDAGSIPALGRRIDLDLSDVTIDDALRAIASASRLELVYSGQVVPVAKRISVKASGITVAAALTEVLFKANVDVLLSGGRIVMVRGREPLQVGTITGRVTDSTSGEGIAGGTVIVEGTRLTATTISDGSYALRAVPVGAHTIVARRLGYARATQSVTVADGTTATMNFVLVRTATTLNDIVTTATGDQRRVELGHVVGRINADSVVKAAPVSSVGELLNGRVTGLQVQTYQGTVGGQVNLRVRSPNTILLDRDPIVIVDGVRYISVTGERITRLSFINYVEPTSPLNDLNPNEIESIEVVKGPSAATLYGTDAANGVIVITTKRGVAGASRWRAYSKAATTEIPKIRYPDQYWGWQTVRGAPSLTQNCDLGGVAGGSCTQDSVVAYRSPLNDPQLTIFAARPRWEYGSSVSGGTRDLRYFLAADFEQATGPFRMPPGLADSLRSARGLAKLPEEQENPNTFTKLNLRSNTTIALGSAGEIQVNTGYIRRATNAFGAFDNPYTAATMYGRPGQQYGAGGPAEYFSRTSTERVNRFFASATGRWSPATWLTARATSGVDITSSTHLSLVRRDEATSTGYPTGEVGDERGRQLATTGELAATASFSTRRLSSRTSIGGQYVRSVNDLLGSVGTDLPPGGSSIGEAVTVQGSQTYREQVTLGSYVEQLVGLNQRLFLTGALRADGASTFGRDYSVAVYPKASVSWLLSEEPMLPRLPFVDELRLRYAFGASGQQPRPEWARPGYEVRQVYLGGALANAYRVTTLGNPKLRPERAGEHEFGFDASGFTNRVAIGLTWYRRTTSDQIVTFNLPPGLGSIQTNLGRTAGRGFEAQVSGRLIESRAISWDVVVQHSFHRTTLEDLGGAKPRRSPYGDSFVKGYPLGARFSPPLLGYDDANRDGIIASSELQLGDSAVYAGESTPPRSLTLASTFGLFERRLRFSALVERHSGFTQMNGIQRAQCGNRLCRGAVDRSATLAEQATAAYSFRYDLIEPGDFTRLREVSVSLDIPSGVTRWLRLSSGTLSLQGRNLALWTSYSGADPESADVESNQAFGIPQGRSWALRFDVGF